MLSQMRSFLFRVRYVMYLCLLLFLLFAVSSCGVVDQPEAESTARAFLNERVKFFTATNASTSDVEQFSIKKTESYKKDNQWQVLFHIEAPVNGTVKASDIAIVVDGRSGEIISFNGKKVLPPKPD